MSGIICANLQIINGETMFLITGGGTGIGRSLALALSKRGKSVLIVGRREQHLQETAAFSPFIDYFCADVSKPEGVESIREHLENIQHIHALVNNAGTIDPISNIRDIQPQAFHQALKTNLDAALFLPQILYKQLKNGRVLNIGSGAAYFPVQGWAAYCVSKAALAMLTRCWQLESDSVAFASVMPGIIDTDMQAVIRNSLNMDSEQVNFYKRLKEHNRLVSPEAVAEFLTWLLLEVDSKTYVSKEWDIYDTSDHKAWLRAPHQVLHWDF